MSEVNQAPHPGGINVRYAAAALATLLILVTLSVVQPVQPHGPTAVPIPAKKAPTSLDPGWVAKALEGIETSEYQFSRIVDGRWGAPNRAHDLTSMIDREGMTLKTLTRETSRWSFGLQLSRFGRSGRLAAQEPAVVSAEAGRAQLAHGPALTEWYVNDR